ncbi:MAG: DotU family type IV/VI secretion system protein [Phycisphaerales bacterium]
MTLTEVCEPVFQYACRLHRGARKGVWPPAAQVVEEVASLMDDVRSRAAAEPALLREFDQVRPVLLYFLDGIVRSSRLPYAGRWAELAVAEGHPGGDEDFFDRLEATLADKSDGATQRLGVFYVCMGLGFSGWYRGQPDHLRRKMSEIASRIRAGLDADRAAKVCPDAYEGVNTADLVEPPSRRLAGVAIVLVGLALTVFIANAVLYRERRADLVRSLEEIERLSAPDAAAPTAGEGGRSR